MKWLENEGKTVRVLLRDNKVKVDLVGIGIAEIELGEEAYLNDFAAEAEAALEKLSKGSKLYEIEYFRRTYYRGPGYEQKLQKIESVKFKAYLKVADVEAFGSPYKAYLAAKKRYA